MIGNLLLLESWIEWQWVLVALISRQTRTKSSPVTEYVKAWKLSTICIRQHPEDPLFSLFQIQLAASYLASIDLQTHTKSSFSESRAVLADERAIS